MVIKAIIFDMDGVILNSMPMHIKIWEYIFKRRELAFTLELFQEFNGRNSKDIAEEMIQRYDLQEKAEDILSEKMELERKYWDEMLALFPDADGTLISLRDKGYKLALGTSALPHMTEHVFNKFKLEKYFDAVVSAKDVEHTKPAPDIFLLAAKKLDTIPEECAVVEDAVMGVEAANKAGMISIGITTTFRAEAFIDADKVIKRLKDLLVEDFFGE